MTNNFQCSFSTKKFLWYICNSLSRPLKWFRADNLAAVLGEIVRFFGGGFSPPQKKMPEINAVYRRASAVNHAAVIDTCWTFLLHIQFFCDVLKSLYIAVVVISLRRGEGLIGLWHALTECSLGHLSPTQTATVHQCSGARVPYQLGQLIAALAGVVNYWKHQYPAIRPDRRHVLHWWYS